MSKTTSVIFFCIDSYFDLIENVIKSFESVQIINKFYILTYDKPQTLIQSDKVIYVDLSEFSYNVNICYNSIKSRSDVWLIWKPTYYFNSNKTTNLNSIIESIYENAYQICFIFGIKFFLDIDHIKQDQEFSCRNGGCFLISNTVTLNDSEIYFNVNKSNHKINYNLYDNSEYYFFDVSLANSPRVMLLNDFESMYITYLKNNEYINFVSWYEMLYKPINIGSQYVKKKYAFDGRTKKDLHQYCLPNFMKKYHIPEKNLVMSYVVVISTLDDISRLYITVNSLRDQAKQCTLLIIINNNFGQQFVCEADTFIKTIQVKEQLSISDCYDIAINNVDSDIITFVKSGVIITPLSNERILETYNNSYLDNVFVYPTVLEGCVLNNSNNNINKCFISFKTKYYSKINENTFCNENINLLFKIETLCRPITLLGLIDISNCNIQKELQIEKYLRLELINKCITERYQNLNINVASQIICSNGIKISHVDDYAILNKNILNVYFDKIYCRKKIEQFDDGHVIYEITNIEDTLLVNKCYDQKLNAILIVNDNVNLDINIKTILNKNHNFDKIIFNTCATGYILNVNSHKGNTYYFKKEIQPVANQTSFNPYPKISIIMTVYNKEKYVESAIESILRQTYKNLELIIVEDCSTDNSLQIVNKFGLFQNVKIIRNKQNSGCYVSRNIGISNANGSIIGFQDADDYTLSERIEKQLNLMLGKNLLMVGCNMIRSHIPNINYTNDSDILKAVNANIKHFDRDCCNEMFGYPTLLIKKELFDKYGKYIERLKGMDMEFPERVMFKELGKKFSDSSWEFFDKESNEIYEKLDDLLVISPDMNETNISNSIKTDEYLQNKLWREQYV